VTKDQVRVVVKDYLPHLMFDRIDAALEKTNTLLNPLVEDGSIDGFDTMYDDADRSFAIDIYYTDGLCDTFSIQPGATIQERLG
jgi:hypothetical protein